MAKKTIPHYLDKAQELYGEAHKERAKLWKPGISESEMRNAIADSIISEICAEECLEEATELLFKMLLTA